MIQFTDVSMRQQLYVKNRHHMNGNTQKNQNVFQRLSGMEYPKGFNYGIDIPNKKS